MWANCPGLHFLIMQSVQWDPEVRTTGGHLSLAKGRSTEVGSGPRASQRRQSYGVPLPSDKLISSLEGTPSCQSTDAVSVGWGNNFSGPEGKPEATVKHRAVACGQEPAKRQETYVHPQVEVKVGDKSGAGALLRCWICHWCL